MSAAPPSETAKQASHNVISAGSFNLTYSSRPVAAPTMKRAAQTPGKSRITPRPKSRTLKHPVDVPACAGGWRESLIAATLSIPGHGRYLDTAVTPARPLREASITPAGLAKPTQRRQRRDFGRLA
jgi:hypothetical protein